MIGALYISGKNIFWSTHVYKNRERKIFEILRCPFELPAKQHRPFGQDGLTGRCCLAGNSKGHRLNIFFSMISSVLLCGFDQGPIHIPWTIHKSKPLFQTTVEEHISDFLFYFALTMYARRGKEKKYISTSAVGF